MEELTVQDTKQNMAPTALVTKEQKFFNYRAARTKWPGNDTPIFRNHPSNLNELNNLATKLTPKYSLPCFNPKQIRKHILDTLTERRRNMKRGHDYNCVSISRDRLESC